MHLYTFGMRIWLTNVCAIFGQKLTVPWSSTLEWVHLRLAAKISSQKYVILVAVSFVFTNYWSTSSSIRGLALYRKQAWAQTHASHAFKDQKFHCACICITWNQFLLVLVFALAWLAKSRL
jgi:hypothetical protein